MSAGNVIPWSLLFISIGLLLTFPFLVLRSAVKFTSEGGITLRVDQEDRAEDSLLTFQLDDTGVGIAKEILPQLFKPFHQGNVSISRQYGGSGLGLSIAKSVGNIMCLVMTPFVFAEPALIL